MKINWANLKSVALHASIVFVATLATTLGATSDITRSTVIAAIATAGIAALHGLSGLLPNPAASATNNAATVKKV